MDISHVIIWLTAEVYMHTCSNCGYTYAWHQSLSRHMKEKHGTDDQGTSPQMDSDGSTNDSSIDSKKNSQTFNDDSDSSPPEDAWDAMTVAIFNTEDYNNKVSEYVMNCYAKQKAHVNAKRDMLDVHVMDLKFRYYKLLLMYHQMRTTEMHKKIMADVKRFCKKYSYKKALRAAIHHCSSMFRSLLEDAINEDEEEDDDRRYFEQFSD